MKTVVAELKDIKMTDKLTAKQEAFAQKYVVCLNASEAYRTAYDVGENTKPESIWCNSSQILSDAKVAQRVSELQEINRERLFITIGSLTSELEMARQLAMSEGKSASAAVSAIMGKAKLHGLIVDKAEYSGKNGGPMEAVTKIELVCVDPKPRQEGHTPV
jgi:2',3'-cyclic-nucleotide 2'-phosphodiesterase (5'-nucleotidase family)